MATEDERFDLDCEALAFPDGHKAVALSLVARAFKLGEEAGEQRMKANCVEAVEGIGGVDHEPGTINGSSWKYDFWQDILEALKKIKPV